MAKRRQWSMQQQANQVQRQIQGGQSPRQAVSNALDGGSVTATQHGNNATTLGTAGADTLEGGGTAAGVAAVAGAEGAAEAPTGATATAGMAGEAEAGATNTLGVAGGDTIQGGAGGGAAGRASGSALAERLVHRARGFATEVSDMLFRGVKKR